MLLCDNGPNKYRNAVMKSVRGINTMFRPLKNTLYSVIHVSQTVIAKTAHLGAVNP